MHWDVEMKRASAWIRPLRLGFGVALATLALAATAAPAFAQEALVEEADAGIGVERFDYVEAGQKIDLAPDRRLVVSYLRSCWRETIRGGMVTIGRELSAVAGGTVERERVKCSAGALDLKPGEGEQSAVMVFRAPAKLTEAAMRSLGGRIAVRNVLYGAAPIVELPGGGKVSIERLDADGPVIAFEVPRGANAMQSRYDLAKAGQALAPGGLYRARWGPPSRTRSLLFAVHESAVPGAGSALGRLLRLPAP